MQAKEPSPRSWLLRRFSSFSLDQLYMLSIVFILVFTVLFSLLLIYDEYHSFTKAIDEKRAGFLQLQEQKIRHSAEKFEGTLTLLRKAHERVDPELIKELIAVFSGSDQHFLLLYDAERKPLFEKVHPAGLSAEDFSVKRVQRHEVRVGEMSEEALLYAIQMEDGSYLVSGAFTKAFETMMKAEAKSVKSRQIKIVLEIVTLAFILFGFILGVSVIVNNLLDKDVKAFLQFFEGVVGQDHRMRVGTLFFREFRTMAGHANVMVETIADQKASLEQLNLTLEDRVKMKIALLQEKNSALEAEQRFSHALLASQKQFIRYAIHETNTPLSVIMANIELYGMHHGKDRYLGKIESAVKNIFSIYDDLNYLVKKDQVEYPKQMINMCEYVQSRVNFFDEVASNAGVSFRYLCNAQEAKIMFNETKLQRIVDNNLTNAIKYTRYGEPIMVKVLQEGNTYRFIVESRSSVIQDIGRIFEAYYREHSDRNSSEGFGLGLNLVKSICDEEGVDISLESTEELTSFGYTFKMMIA